jgi:hypothetical protein
MPSAHIVMYATTEVTKSAADETAPKTVFLHVKIPHP